MSWIQGQYICLRRLARVAWSEAELQGRQLAAAATVLVLGTLVSQVLALAFSVFIARIYSTDSFGHYTLIMSISAVLTALSTASYDKLILFGDRDDSISAVYIVVIVSAGFALSISAAYTVLSLCGVSIASNTTAIEGVLIVPTFVFLSASLRVFTYLCLRADRTLFISINKVAQTALTGVAQVGLSITALPGLVLGATMGLLVPLFSLVAVRRGEYGFRAPTLERIVSSAKKNWRYPRYLMPNEVVDIFSNQVPLILIGSFSSLLNTGAYGLALTMLSAPAALLGQAVGQAFMQQMGKLENLRAAERLMTTIWIVLGVVGVVPFAVIAIFGPEIFALVFGQKWIAAGDVAVLLTPLLLVRFISSPTSTIYIKLEMQREQFYFCIAAAIYRTISYVPLAFGYSLNVCIMIHVILEIVGILAYNGVALLRLRSLDNSLTPASNDARP